MAVVGSIGSQANRQFQLANDVDVHLAMVEQVVVTDVGCIYSRSGAHADGVHCVYLLSLSIGGAVSGFLRTAVLPFIRSPGAFVVCVVVVVFLDARVSRMPTGYSLSPHKPPKFKVQNVDDAAAV
jgi:hypothetical protein